jgi:imidazolonepropionase
MITLLKNPSQIITVDTKGKNYKRGLELNEIEVLENHSIIIEDKSIKDIIPNGSIKGFYDAVLDLEGKVVTPGLIECHTHTVFSGSRANEFRLKLKGVNYEEIVLSGGGINSTVTAVRNSSEDELFHSAKQRINYFISQGITTLEIKSGYGLNFDTEVKILNVIKKLKSSFEIDIIPTFLGAHIVPKEFKENRDDYIRLIVDKMIPYISTNNLALFCDAFCESTAFSSSEVEKILQTAKVHGLKLKLHSEQFNNIGGIDLAFGLNVTSIDHLEMIKEADISKFNNSEIVAVLLPGVSFFLNYDFAPARKLIEQNAIVAVSTDYNPGSSHIANINLIMSIASLKMKMTIEETICAVTINAAKALDVQKSVGSIEVGKNADFAVFNTSDYSDIVYSVGKNLNCMTIKNGKIIYKNIGDIYENC